MLHGYLSRVYTDLLSLPMSAEEWGELAFSCRHPRAWRYCTYCPRQQHLGRHRDAPRVTEQHRPWTIYGFQQRLRCKRTGPPGQSLRQPRKKCQACTQLYEILITCEGESKISPFNFSLFSLNQNKLAWQLRANWVLTKTGMKMTRWSVPLFLLMGGEKKNPSSENWIEDESSVALLKKKSILVMQVGRRNTAKTNARNPKVFNERQQHPLPLLQWSLLPDCLKSNYSRLFNSSARPQWDKHPLFRLASPLPLEGSGGLFMMSSHGQGHVINYSTETSWGLWGPPAYAGGEAVGVRYCILNSSLKEMFLSLKADNNVQKSSIFTIFCANQTAPMCENCRSSFTSCSWSWNGRKRDDSIPARCHSRLRPSTSALCFHLTSAGIQHPETRWG